jgi:hypothetical protein
MKNLRNLVLQFNRVTGGAISLLFNDSVRLFNLLRYWYARATRYQLSEISSEDTVTKKAVDELKKYGVTCLPGMFLDVVDELCGDFYNCLDHGKFDNPVNNQVLEKTGKRSLMLAPKTRGEVELLRHKTNNIQIKSPLLQSELIKKISANKVISQIADNYLRCKSISTGANFRLSFANSLKPEDTQIFHQDKDAFKVVKFFIYLTDVGDIDGPFQYVLGSHVGPTPLRVRRYHRISEDDVLTNFKDKIKTCSGKKGDLIIADTTGIHRGLKPAAGDRLMLTLTRLPNAELKT